MTGPIAYVSRVNQIDSAQLDNEIYKILKNQVAEVSRYQLVGRVDKWQPELDALLKILIWSFSLRNGKSTFGQQLLNLHYGRMGKRESRAYLILTVLPAYIRDKLAEHRCCTSDAGNRVKALLDLAVYLVKLLELLNLVMFLHRGTQPRLVDRVLGIRSEPIKSQGPRNIGYSYMTRELLWHGLMELFTVGLPMINFHYLKEAAKSLFQRTRFGETPTGKKRASPSVGMSSSRKCPYCSQTPVLPAQADCEHLFCYYCLMAHFTAMSAFHCPECGTELHRHQIRNYLAIPPSQDAHLPDLEKLDTPPRIL